MMIIARITIATIVTTEKIFSTLESTESNSSSSSSIKSFCLKEPLLILPISSSDILIVGESLATNEGI